MYLAFHAKDVQIVYTNHCLSIQILYILKSTRYVTSVFFQVHHIWAFNQGHGSAEGMQCLAKSTEMSEKL